MDNQPVECDIKTANIAMRELRRNARMANAARIASGTLSAPQHISTACTRADIYAEEKELLSRTREVWE
jgi:hypothetical protein